VTSSEQTDTTLNQSEAHLKVTVGTEAFEPGLTQVMLDPTGLVHVLSKLEGSDERRAEARLDPARAIELIRTARISVTEAREGKRYGLPDEPRYRFEIGEGDKRQSFEVWRSDLPQHPELNRIVMALQQIVEEQARGEIIL
jgi:hypothetical protein